MKGDVIKKSKQFFSMIASAKSIAIIGHVHPDGDCVGATLGLYNYINDNYKGKNLQVYMDGFAPCFRFLSGTRKVKHDPVDEHYDLAVSVDVASKNRLGKFEEIFNSAISAACIDHHVSNEGFGDLCYVDATASSACEVLCDLMDPDKISAKTASCLYTGIVHDTGVFKYTSTSRKTMEIGGMLIEKGAPSDVIIDDTFYKKTFKQNKLMARVVLDSVLYEGGKIVFGTASKEIFKEYKCTTMDTEGIVEQLRLTDGAEVAIFAYQLTNNTYKFSLRAKHYVDVNKIANTFGGGGHMKAAGFETEIELEKVVEQLIEEIKEQLK